MYRHRMAMLEVMFMVMALCAWWWGAKERPGFTDQVGERRKKRNKLNPDKERAEKRDCTLVATTPCSARGRVA